MHPNKHLGALSKRNISWIIRLKKFFIFKNRLTKNMFEISIMEYGPINVVFVRNHFKLNWPAKNMPKRPIEQEKNIQDVPKK